MNGEQRSKYDDRQGQPEQPLVNGEQMSKYEQPLINGEQMSKYEQPLVNGEQISKYEQQPRKQKRKFDNQQIHHINKILEDRQPLDEVEDAKITKRKRNYSPIRFDLDEENTKSSPPEEKS